MSAARTLADVAFAALQLEAVISAADDDATAVRDPVAINRASALLSVAKRQAQTLRTDLEALARACPEFVAPAPAAPDLEQLLHRLRVQLDAVEQGTADPGNAERVLDAAYALETAQELVAEIIRRVGAA